MSCELCNDALDDCREDADRLRRERAEARWVAMTLAGALARSDKIPAEDVMRALDTMRRWITEEVKKEVGHGG